MPGIRLGDAMQRKRLALYTFGIFRAPADDAANRGFHERNDVNFLAAELSEGFIARSGYLDEPGPESWGEQVYSRFYVERDDGYSPSTLSLWKDLVSPMAYAYAGIHAEVLRRAGEWFDKPDWPKYVLWWVDHDRTPTWAEAVAKHELLHDRKATPLAFDFTSPFDEGGRPAVVGREAVRNAMRANEIRQDRLQ
jgi:hypothetical protein